MGAHVATSNMGPQYLGVTFFQARGMVEQWGNNKNNKALSIFRICQQIKTFWTWILHRN